VLNSVVPSAPAVRGAIWDPSTTELFVADFGGRLLRVNLTTDSIDRTVFLGGTPSAIALDPVNGRLYISDGANDWVDIVGARSGGIQHQIPVGPNPDGIVYIPTFHSLVVANGGSNNLSVINAATGKVTRSIPGGVGPGNLAYDPANGNLYVADGPGCGSSAVSCNLTVVHFASGTVVATISVPNSPDDVAVGTGSGSVFATIPRYSEILRINTTTNTATVAATLATHAYPTWIVAEPAMASLYVTDAGFGTGGNNLTQLNGTTGSRVASFSVPGPLHLVTYPVVDALNGTLYFFNQPDSGLPGPLLRAFFPTTGRFDPEALALAAFPDGVLSVPSRGQVWLLEREPSQLQVYRQDGSWIATVPGSFANATTVGGSVGPTMVSDPSASEVFVACPNGSSIAIVNTTNFGIVGYLADPGGPTALAYDPGNADRAGNLSVFDVSTRSPVASVAFPGVRGVHPGIPTGLAFDSAAGRLFVAVSAVVYTCNRYSCTTASTVRIVPIDTRTDTVVRGANISTNGALSGALVFDTTNQRLYLADNFPQYALCDVLVLDPANRTQVAHLSLTPSNYGSIGTLVVDPTTGNVYATVNTNWAQDGLYRISPSNSTVSGFAHVGFGAEGAAWVSGTGNIWVASYLSGTLAVVSP
jgi:YVTN family beta-propeller protein